MEHAVRLPLKVVSTNALYVGKRYKSKVARQFEWDIARLLSVKCRDITLPEGDLVLALRVGTTRRMDTSNAIKLVEDCIARHFGINDRRFAAVTVIRVPVKSGSEFISFQLSPYNAHDWDLWVRELPDIG